MDRRHEPGGYATERAGELLAQREALDEHAIVAVTDAKGVITYVNDRFCQISGYTRQELLGQTHSIVNGGHHPRSFFTDLWRTIASGDVWRGEICNRAKDGTAYWVQTTILPQLGDDGRPRQYIAVRSDITGMKLLNRDLRTKGESLERLNSTLNAQREALAAKTRVLEFQRRALDEHAILAITDAKGVITFVNDKFCEISGYSREELLGNTHALINSGHHPKGFFTDLWRTIARGDVWSGEICNRAKDGSEYWVQTTIVPFADPRGKILQYAAIRTDVTGIKRVENELRNKSAALEQSNSELEQFVYAASHDLKSPLVTILGFAAYLKQDFEQERFDRVFDYLGRIESAASHLRDNVDQLLHLSRVGRTEVATQQVDPEEITRTVIALLDEEIRSIGASISLDFGTTTVRANPVRFEQAVLNLLTNALKFGASDSPLQIVVGSRAEEECDILFVQDNGPGISPNHHARIFDLFESLDSTQGGSGVGLSLVKRIAQTHGGRVWVESTPGEGATFRVSFPRPDPTTQDSTQGDSNDSGQ